MSKRKGSKRAHSEMHMLSTKKFRDDLLGGQKDYDENLLAESSDDSDDNEALLKDEDDDDEEEDGVEEEEVKEKGKGEEEFEMSDSPAVPPHILPFLLLDYAEEVCYSCTTMSSEYSPEEHDKLIQASKALDQAKDVLLGLPKNEAVSKMFDKACKRLFVDGINDGKVSKGSDSVSTHRMKDARYLLSTICLVKAKIWNILTLRLHSQAAITALYESLIFAPRNIGALYLLAISLKCISTTENGNLVEVERLLKKAVTCPVGSFADYDNTTTTTSSSSSSSSSGGGVKISGQDFQRTKEALKCSKEALALLLCQTGRGRTLECYKLLRSLGYGWRISSQVLDYPTAPAGPSGGGSTVTYARAVDGAFTSEALRRIQYLFRPSSAYWSEHEYDLGTNSSRVAKGGGYFSYQYPFRARGARVAVEALCDSLLKLCDSLMPSLALAAHCEVMEWWVHTRPHSSGHQLHFDSDETRIEDGGAPSHPLASCILFLDDEGTHPGDGSSSSSSSSSTVGGPTLITNQTLTGVGMATEGALCQGRHGRVCVFDAQYLHGVVPGKGAMPAGGGSSVDSSAINGKSDGNATGNIGSDGSGDGNENKRRLTLMVGFWKKVQARPRGTDTPGPAQALPAAGTTKYSWLQEMALPPEKEEKGGGSAPASSGAFPVQHSGMTAAPLVAIDEVWCTIDSGVHTGKGGSSRGGGSSSGLRLDKLKLPSYDAIFQGF